MWRCDPCGFPHGAAQVQGQEPVLIRVSVEVAHAVGVEHRVEVTHRVVTVDREVGRGKARIGEEG